MNHQQLTYHCYNGNHTKVAVVPNSNIVEIWNVNGFDTKNWTLDQTLKEEHTQLITCVDWAPKSNRILTCAQDRNAFVWVQKPNKEWDPEIVLLRFERAATCCSWSPEENKFVVGGAERNYAVCYYLDVEKWWMCKRLAKHKSSILSIGWHPSNAGVISASCDGTVAVSSTLLKEAKDSSSTVEAPGLGTFKGWAAKDPPLFAKEVQGSWISSAVFSPSGKRIAFCTRNSVLHIHHLEDKSEFKLSLKNLPYTHLLFANEDAIVAAGFDPHPSLIKFEANKWTFSKFLDVQSALTTPALPSMPKSMASEAMKHFQSLTKFGQSDQNVKALKLGSDHLNATTSLKAYQKSGDSVSVVSTTSLDGQLLFWKV